MIRADKDGNCTRPDLITISELLSMNDLEIDLPKPELEAKVDACLKECELNITNISYIFNHKDEYYVVIYPKDSQKPIIEIEVGHSIRFYKSDGSYHFDINSLYNDLI